MGSSGLRVSLLLAWAVVALIAADAPAPPPAAEPAAESASDDVASTLDAPEEAAEEVAEEAAEEAEAAEAEEPPAPVAPPPSPPPAPRTAVPTAWNKPAPKAGLMSKLGSSKVVGTGAGTVLVALITLAARMIGGGGASKPLTLPPTVDDLPPSDGFIPSNADMWLDRLIDDTILRIKLKLKGK